MLYAVIAAAIVFAALGSGMRGSAIGLGMSLSMLMMGIYFLWFALLYWSALSWFGKKKSSQKLLDPTQKDTSS